MGIDLDKYQSEKFESRTEKVDVPFFDKWAKKKGKPFFLVRGLSGEEFYEVREAVTRAANTQELISRLLTGEVKEKVDAALETLGLGDQLPDEYVRRLNILRLGSVDPKIDLKAAKRIALDHPTFFQGLTDKIQELTGMGRQMLGESKPFGQTPK